MSTLTPTPTLKFTSSPNSMGIISRMCSFIALPKGWFDGNEIAISEEIVLNIASALRKCEKIPDNLSVAPLPEGIIRFEWSVQSDDFILEIDNKGSMYMCILAYSAENDTDAEFDLFDAKRIQKFMEEGVIV